MFLKPDYNLKSVYDINLDELKLIGVKAVLFDLDSTLMASKSGFYTDETYSFLRSVEEKFFIAIISNNHNPEYMEKVRFQFNLKPEDCVIVGDRPLTDILCGKLLGCKTILVDSITADTESKLVRFVRWLERLTIRK